VSFQEKSAYITVIMLLMGGGFYFYEVMSQSLRFDEWVSLVIPELIKLTLILIIVSIIGHIMIVTISPKEAEAKLDEREKQIFYRAASLSGVILGFAVIISLGIHLISENGTLLFYTVFAGLIISQLAKYGIRIFLYRTVI
jgi:hypothetical protein